MTAVFLGFVGDPDVVVKTIGLGLASAILIDVLIVRMIVAPAVMTLLGDRAWALPGWLDRALPKIALGGRAGAGLGAHGAAPDGAAPRISRRPRPGAGRARPSTVKTEQQHEATPNTSRGSNDWPEIRSRPPSISAVNGLSVRDRLDPPAEQVSGT